MGLAFGRSPVQIPGINRSNWFFGVFHSHQGECHIEISVLYFVFVPSPGDGFALG